MEKTSSLSIFLPCNSRKWPNRRACVSEKARSVFELKVDRRRFYVLKWFPDISVRVCGMLWCCQLNRRQTRLTDGSDLWCDVGKLRCVVNCFLLLRSTQIHDSHWNWLPCVNIPSELPFFTMGIWSNHSCEELLNYLLSTWTTLAILYRVSVFVWITDALLPARSLYYIAKSQYTK